MIKGKNGMLWAFGIIFLPIITFIIIYPYSRALGFNEVLYLYSRPAVLAFIIIILAATLFYLRKNIQKVKLYMKSNDQNTLEPVQKILVKLPRTLLIAGMATGIIFPQVLLFFHPNGNSLRPDALLLGFGNEIFFGMPPYILFVQRFETWSKFVPFSDNYQSMSLSARVNLVSAFILISMSGMLMITLKNSFTGISGTITYGLVWQRSFPILIVGFVGGVINMFLLMKGITKRIILCQGYADSLSKGKISAEKNIAVSRDELGALGDRLGKIRINTFELISGAKNTIKESLEVKDELGVMSEKAVSAMDELTNQINSVVARIESLDENIDETTSSVDRFSERINNITNGIMEQAAMTEESNASITEIIASVESISEVAQNKMKSSTALNEASEEGNKKLSETVGRINEIGEQAGKINEITRLIQAIAAQTNLLAMNAAIEAAHAGDAGKGFAVVADEIRKLANNASTNSKQISDSVKQITASIGSANFSADSSVESFNRIKLEIKNVIESFQEIDYGLGELKTSGGHILKAVTSLNESSQNLKGDADVMKKEAQITGKKISDLRDLSEQTHKVTERMTEEVISVREQVGIIKKQAVRLDNTTTMTAETLEKFEM